MKCKAIGRIEENGKLLGYVLQDEFGNTMRADKESIKRVLLNKQAEITNLKITADGRLIHSENNRVANREPKYIKNKLLKGLAKIADDRNVTYRDGRGYILDGIEYGIKDKKLVCYGRFSGMTVRKSLYLVDDLEAIMPEAFANRKIQEVTIPNTVMFIGKSAFEGCRLLTEVYISHQTHIETDAFKGCSNLTDRAKESLRQAGYAGSF